MKHFFTLFLLSIALNIWGQTNQDEVITLATGGYPHSSEHQAAINTVSDIWNIQYKTVGMGCMISQEDIAEIRRLEEEADKILSARKGENWKEQYHLEVQLEIEAQKIWKERLEEKEILSQLIKQNNLDAKDLHLAFNRKKGAKNYYLTITTYEWVTNDELVWNTVAKYFLDDRTKSINPLSLN